MQTWLTGQSHGYRIVAEVVRHMAAELETLEESIGRAGNLKRKEVKQFRLFSRERKGVLRARFRFWTGL